MPFNFGLYYNSIKGFTDEGVPRDIAEAASRITASEGDEINRTPEQQEIVERAWRCLFKLPPKDGAVLGGTNARQTTNE